jgi:dolichol-phosphate mannosyltransferase
MPERERVVVVLPTYNERENLGALLEALEAEFARLPYDAHVLVVDDSSPDGTADVAREAGRRWGNVHLLLGEKRGLGVAYRRGIKHALDELSADVVVQMDGDFSHNPADLPRLLDALEAGADFVIGSRYVKGGRAPDDWGPVRRTISLAANLGARFIAGLYRVHDCTNGFRAIRGSLLRRVDLDDAPPRGYAILAYLIHQAITHGGRVVEVPIAFLNRAKGESKLRIGDALELFVNVWWVRYDRPGRFYGLALGGLSGIAANIAAIALFRELGDAHALVASALAIEVSVLYGFAWREFWSLALGRGREVPAVRFGLYHLVSLPSALLTFATFALLWGAGGMHYLAAQAIGILPALAWNYMAGDRLLRPVWSQLSQASARAAGVPFGRSTTDGR